MIVNKLCPSIAPNLVVHMRVNSYKNSGLTVAVNKTGRFEESTSNRSPYISILDLTFETAAE